MHEVHTKPREQRVARVGGGGPQPVVCGQVAGAAAGAAQVASQRSVSASSSAMDVQSRTKSRTSAACSSGKKCAMRLHISEMASASACTRLWISALRPLCFTRDIGQMLRFGGRAGAANSDKRR